MKTLRTLATLLLLVAVAVPLILLDGLSRALKRVGRAGGLLQWWVAEQGDKWMARADRLAGEKP